MPRRRRSVPDSDVEDNANVVVNDEDEKDEAEAEGEEEEKEKKKWRFRWRRFVPIIAYQHVLMFILTISIVAWSLLLAGCSSSFGYVPEIYLISLSYNAARSQTSASSNTTNTQYLNLLRNISQTARLDIRAGFFAICVRLPTPIQNQADWDCGDASSLTSRYAEDVDPLRLIPFASDFASKIEFYGLIIGVIVLSLVAFILFSTFPGWRTTTDKSGSVHEVKPFPSRTVATAALVALTFASLFSIVTILWLHVGAVVATELLDSVFDNLVLTKLGAAALSLGWIAVFLVILVSLGTLVMMLSIMLLDRLTRDDEEEDD